MPKIDRAKEPSKAERTASRAAARARLTGETQFRPSVVPTLDALSETTPRFQRKIKNARQNRDFNDRLIFATRRSGRKHNAFRSSKSKVCPSSLLIMSARRIMSTGSANIFVENAPAGTPFRRAETPRAPTLSQDRRVSFPISRTAALRDALKNASN